MAYPEQDPLDPQPDPALAPPTQAPLPSADASHRGRPPAPQQGDPLWLILGPNGLRAGWSIVLFIVLAYFLANVLGTIFSELVRGLLHRQLAGETAGSAIVSEGAWVSALALTLGIVSRLEHRRMGDYYLAGPAMAARFLGGLACGFGALSLLVGLLAWGGWIHLAIAPTSGSKPLVDAGLWSIAFLFVGLTEEGSFRCYLQFTLARGISFWWAVAGVGTMCLSDLAHPGSHGAGGVYAMTLLGLVPCLLLHLRRTPGSGFWQAAWVGSTFFGFIHTGNNGETWIGILAAATIGFVFCASVRLTGSAWWAIGCHAAWDWGETYFYGTADSGFVARGHLFTATPAGAALWSGGTDGPEGSVLVLPVILLLLGALVALYGRKRSAPGSAAPLGERVPG
ncbi:CPBP family intramembrane metalloprotease [Acidobacteria bacterium AB60]|nr:CPBP family intramembrane metalloprotease [Acidobacteria bacterium AB60]